MQKEYCILIDYSKKRKISKQKEKYSLLSKEEQKELKKKEALFIIKKCYNDYVFNVVIIKPIFLTERELKLLLSEIFNQTNTSYFKRLGTKFYEYHL